MNWVLILATAIAGILIAYLTVFRRPAQRSTPAPPLAPRRHRAVATDTGAGVVPDTAEVAETPVEGPLPPALVAFWLADEHELAPDRCAEITEQLRHIVMPPRGVQRFMSADITTVDASRELAELVMSEPRLTARLLGRANSSFYGLQMPIGSVPHAITYLGMNAVRSMALSFLLEESFTSDDPKLREYHDQVWTSGLFASELCSLLATRLGFSDAATLCTQTILSFIGDLAAPPLLGNEAHRAYGLGLVDRLRFEQETIGASSILLGTLVMRDWGLPDTIVSSVSATGRVIATPVTRLPEEIAARAGFSYACTRIGEAIARRRIKHIDQIDLLDGDDPELHHLQGYLRLPALAPLVQQLESPDIRIPLIRMIAAANSEASSTPA